MISVSAHHATAEDSYGVTVSVFQGQPFFQTGFSLPFDAFLYLMRKLDAQREEILAERQARADVEAFSQQVAA